MALGRLLHVTVDAVLVSAVLAGIKRSTGLGLASEKIESKDLRDAVDKYLNVGEWVVDKSIFFMSSSGYFERRR
ncbi:9571_t:CDS:2 [Paraglomus brasilianum]|uniref:9571_t:CDS:1 n=1 Tax=Paraglomus brasilianum TaxID=144538 RepID=A0A9N9G3Q6_9GLOM|nr:9571_t:CDS:2 [Paraglomus brasilianum]